MPFTAAARVELQVALVPPLSPSQAQRKELALSEVSRNAPDEQASAPVGCVGVVVLLAGPHCPLVISPRGAVQSTPLPPFSPSQDQLKASRVLILSLKVPALQPDAASGWVVVY